MTIELSKVEVSEPRLAADNSNQNISDRSFEEKLKFEKARLGLLFSPFSQLGSFFSSPTDLTFSSTITEDQLNSCLVSETNHYNLPENRQNYGSSNPSARSQLQMFDSAPPPAFNRQMLQELLSKTNWLVPNLSALPFFYQAFLDGKLQPKLDLQFLIDQIIDQVKVVKEKGKTELILGLKPENLGEILLILSTHSGIVSIQINASPETKKLIDSQREELERALKKAKIRFDKIEVREVEKNA